LETETSVLRLLEPQIVPPVENRIAFQVMPEPVRSYVSGKAASRELAKKVGVVYNE
jgi:hypothetical protein